MNALDRARARTAGPPEDSVALRLVVAAMVEWAILAVVAQGAVDAVTAVAALVLAPAGYALSYVRRRRPSVGLKAALALALLLALGGFLQGVSGAMSFEDVRAPLAALFLWVQVLHAFDVPRRRDLGFSAVSSLILIAQAGSMSFGTGFLVLLVPWLALAGVWMFLTLEPSAETLRTVVSVRRIPAARRTVAAAWSVGTPVVAVLAAVGAVFVALPRLPGASVALPPFSTDRQTAVEGFDGGVENPGLVRGPDGVADYAPFAYPGFGDELDLRGRGRLSDEVAFRVRAPQPLLWRGQVFDTYGGTAWTATEEPPLGLGREYDDVFRVPAMSGDTDAVPSNRVLATVFLTRRQPNVVFAPYRAAEVYFPTSTLWLDRYGAIRSPIYLEDGMVYSVISEVPVVSAELLRAESRSRWTRGQLTRYTQLPVDLPERVRALAERIAGDEPTVFDQVQAVEGWLQANTRYELDIPPDPPGVDVVDHFLFERRAGFCEHIASAMVVLLRARGIPARLVTGFGPGERNPFSGYFDVRDSDAHAWVEVLYPGVGWVPYDPTFGVPPADPGVGGRFIAPEILRAIGAFLADAVPEPVKAALGAVGRAVVSITRTAVAVWPLALAIALTLGGLLVALRRRARRRALGPAPTGAALAFAELEEAMRVRGHPRSGPQTPSEFLRDLGLREDERADAEIVVRTFERERFAAGPPPPEDVEAALEAAGRIRERVSV